MFVRMFVTVKVEATGDWGKLHNEKLRNLYCLPSIIKVIRLRRMRWSWHVACIGEMTIAWSGILKGRKLEIPRRTCDDNIKIDLKIR
jgi:hypothetical protein